MSNTIRIQDASGVFVGELTNSRVGRPIGDSFQVNKDALASDVEYLASLANRPVWGLIGELRRIADLYESDAALAREDLKRKGEVEHSEAERLEGVISSLLVSGCNHAVHSSIGTHRRLARLLLRSTRRQVVVHNDSSTHGRPDSARGANVEAGARGGHCPGPRVDAPQDGVA